MALESRELRLSVSLGASFPPLLGGKCRQLEGLIAAHPSGQHTHGENVQTREFAATRAFPDDLQRGETFQYTKS